MHFKTIELPTDGSSLIKRSLASTQIHVNGAFITLVVWEQQDPDVTSKFYPVFYEVSVVNKAGEEFENAKHLLRKDALDFYNLVINTTT